MITVHDLHLVEPDKVEAWIGHLTNNLRQQDIDEITAAGAVAPQEAIRTSIEHSTHAFVVTDRDDVPVLVFGAAPHPLPGVGIAWLLGTQGILREAYSIAKATPRCVTALNDEYPLLWNYIDGRNSVSMRWLKWGGFSVIGERTLGQGHVFKLFARTKQVRPDAT